MNLKKNSKLVVSTSSIIIIINYHYVKNLILVKEEEKRIKLYKISTLQCFSIFIIDFRLGWFMIFDARLALIHEENACEKRAKNGGGGEAEKGVQPLSLSFQYNI